MCIYFHHTGIPGLTVMDTPLHFLASDCPKLDIVFAGLCESGPVPANAKKLLREIRSNANPHTRKTRITQLKRLYLIERFRDTSMQLCDISNLIDEIAVPLMAIHERAVARTYHILFSSICEIRSPFVLDRTLLQYGQDYWKNGQLCVLANKYFPQFKIDEKLGKQNCMKNLEKMCQFIHDTADKFPPHLICIM